MFVHDRIIDKLYLKTCLQWDIKETVQFFDFHLPLASIGDTAWIVFGSEAAVID